MKYKLEKKEIDINNSNLIGYGKNGNVYKYKGNAIKVFPKGVVPEELLDSVTCSKLCDISTECILLPRKIVYYNSNFSGYSLKLVKKNKTFNISRIEKNNFIEYIKYLEDDIRLLSNKGLLLDGITPDNVIISDKIYITDPSRYVFLGNKNNYALEKLNNFQLHLLLSKLIVSSLKKSDLTSSELKKFRELLLSKEDEIKSSVFFDKLVGNNKDIKTYVKNRGK